MPPEPQLQPPLTGIQAAVFLQGVELFADCSAEQSVRLASIARQRCFVAGERIYATGEPADALYCVVDGRVRLTECDEDRIDGQAALATRVVGPQGAFGVEEILSDRLRRDEARAEVATTALVLDADDFFDLLSNNIEIVKALFRRLLRGDELAGAALPWRSAAMGGLEVA